MPDAINVTLHNVTTETGCRGHCALEIDRVANLQFTKRSSVESFFHDVCGESCAVELNGSEAGSAYSNRVAALDVADGNWAFDG